MATFCFIQLVVLVIFTRSCSAQTGFKVTPTSVSENVGSAIFTITPDVIDGSPWLFVYDTVDNTAMAGVDYVAVTAAVTDPKADTVPSVDVQVTIMDRPGYQGDRIFELEFTAGTNVGSTSFSQLVPITIVEDDYEPVAVSVTSNSPVKEGEGNLMITVTRTDGSVYPFDVEVNTMDGTAIGDEDFQTISTVQIAFGQDEMWKTIEIGIMDDDEAEPTEMFDVSIGGIGVASAVTLAVDLRDNDTPIPFHCRRQGQDCKLPSQCDYEGSCSPCETDYSGDDCMNFAGDAGVCDPVCVEGTCLNGACKCTPGFTGVRCDKKAYFHHCNPTNLSMCITPYGTFTGKIYVIGQETVPACILPLISDPVPEGVAEWCTGYGAVIGFDGDCGTLGPIADGSRTKYELILRVQYNPPHLKGTDEIVTFTCSYENSSVPVSEGTAFSVQADASGQGTPNGGTVDFSPAVQTVTLANGNPIPEILQLNKEIKVCLTVDGVPGYEAVLIRSIILDNRREVPNDKSQLAYEEGCSLNGILFQTPFFESDPAKHSMCYTFASFIMDPADPDPKLGITTNVELYADASDPEAVLDTCAKRRKRATTGTGSSGEKGYSQTVIKLTLGGLTTVTPTGGDTLVDESELSEKECERRWLMPAFIGLGVVAITMVVIIAILGFTVAKQFRVKTFD